MIIQTGMRTDIPAFYSEWFINKIKEGQQKANQNLNSDIFVAETELHFFNDLQLKNISRELNYDVIIERPREGILCRDNQQFK